MKQTEAVIRSARSYDARYPSFLEYIPHWRQQFANPARVEGGFYKTPEIPGLSADLVELEGR